MQNLYKSKKAIFFVVSSIIVITLFVALKFYKRPIPVEKSFNYGVIVKDDKVLNDKVKISLNATLSKSDFLFKELKFRRDLNGTLKMDDTEYKLSTSNLGNGTDNLFWGELKKNNLDSSPAYIVFISEDSNRIYLNNDKECYSISAPSKSIKDFEKIRKEMME